MARRLTVARSAPARRFTAAAVSLLVVVAGGGALWAGLHLLGDTAASRPSARATTSHAPPRSTPASSPPAPSALWQLSISPAGAALTPVPGLPSAGPPPTAAGVRAQLAPLLADPRLRGQQVAMVVADPTGAGSAGAGARVLFDQGGTSDAAPASTAKLAVAVAALHVLGPQHRLTTRVVLDGDGDVVLVGGGDPTLAGPQAVGKYSPGYPWPARLTDLASAAAAALRARGRTAVTLRYDAHIFTGPVQAPGWKPVYYTEGDVAPVVGLEVDEGANDVTKPGRTLDPAAAAAAEFAAALRADGIDIDGAVRSTRADPAATQLAAVASPTVAQLVERMLGRSDNDLAEALARHVALARGGVASFEGAVTAVRATVAELGIDPAGLAMVDASGLSLLDWVHPAALVQLVDRVLDDPGSAFTAIRQGLPVAGFSGTLTDRFTEAPAQAADGAVRAKTGTLGDVVSLAGYLIDSSGRVLSFAVVVSGVPTGAILRTEAAVDRLTTGLVSCGCQ
jgi:serine-type D-Ala-D-Ala carboxypeptidase/endopeptidase (penicillin-binding protein 4)